jgi:hypothetical protein
MDYLCGSEAVSPAMSPCRLKRLLPDTRRHDGCLPPMRAGMNAGLDPRVSTHLLVATSRSQLGSVRSAFVGETRAPAENAPLDLHQLVAVSDRLGDAR